MTQARASIDRLADLVTLNAALERDAGHPASHLAERDRAVVQRLPPTPDDPLAEVAFWLRHSCREEPATGMLRQQVEGALGLVGLAAAATGFFLGLGAALGAFYYDGAGRVNVVGVLAVFAFLPAALLLPFLLTALPVRAASRLPGAAALLPFLRALSPGRLARAAGRWSPPAVREALASVLGRAGAHRQLYAQVERWALLTTSQTAALGYQVAALAAATWLVLFTDLAFGWSTTLSSSDAAADAGTMHRITSWIALPWAWLWPDAVPSAELVTASRYYRLADAAVSPELAARLGGWWRFLLMAMITYGLLPRLVTFTVARFRLRRAVRRAVLATPGVDALRRRLHLARVRTTSPEAEPSTPVASATSTTSLPALTDPGRPACVAAINWSGVPVDAVRIAALLGVRPDRVATAGGACSLEQDRRTIDDLPAPDDDQGIAVLVKGWEPPLADLFDFLQALRARLGRGAPVFLAPVGLDDEGAVAPPAKSDLDVWHRAVTARGDPWLQVIVLPETKAAP